MEELIQQAFQSIAQLNEDFTQMAGLYHTLSIDVAVLKAQMSQVLKLQWTVAVVIIGFVGSRILLLIFNKKNNKK